MPFQFYCPQGHLLQGDESQMGQQSQCPLCGTMFVIPQPNPAAAPQPEAPPVQQPQVNASAPAAEPEQPPEPEQPAIPPIVHIRCSNGHVLETPSEILGKRALCPHCNVQMDLLYESSIEYQREQEQARARREEHINQMWVKWSIRAAIGVGVMFVLMLGYVFAVKPFWKWYQNRNTPASAAVVTVSAAPQSIFSIQ